MDLCSEFLTQKQSFSADNYIKHFKITWTVENFLYSKVRSVILKSPTFKLENLTSWFLTLEPHFINKKAVLCLHRIQKDDGPEKVSVNFRFGLKEDTGATWFTEDHAEFQSGTFKSGHWEIAYYFKNNQPVVLCQMMIVREISDPAELYQNSSQISFMSDLCNLNKSSYLSDFILQIGIHVLKVHKAILVERSQYFRNLFFDQSYNFSFIKLSNINVNELKFVLDFMYSGNFYTWSRLSSMRLVAYDSVVKFGVTHLKDLLAPTEVYLVSECVTDVVEINWQIKRFSYKAEKYVLKSPTFKTAVGSVRFMHNIQSPAQRDTTRMYIVIEPLSPSTKVGTSRIHFSILDTEKNKHNQQVKLTNLDKTFRAFFKIEQHLLSSMRSRLLPEDVLTISCQIETPTYKTKDKKLDVHKNSIDRSVQFLSFSSLLESGNHSDFTLLAGDQTFRVHKAILAARSNFFHQLFKDHKENSVTIADLRPNTLTILLSYIYSGQIRGLDIDCGLELQKVSEKYSVTLLDHMLTEFFLSKCNPEDVCELVLKSDCWKVEETKNLAVNYLILNFNNVQESEHWKCLLEQKNELASEILYKVSEDVFANLFIL